MSEPKSLWGILYDPGAVRCPCRQTDDRSLDLRVRDMELQMGPEERPPHCGSSRELVFP